MVLTLGSSISPTPNRAGVPSVRGDLRKWHRRSWRRHRASCHPVEGCARKAGVEGDESPRERPPWGASERSGRIASGIGTCSGGRFAGIPRQAVGSCETNWRVCSAKLCQEALEKSERE